MYVGKPKKKIISKLRVRHYSRLSKSRFKNYQVAKRRSKLLWSSTVRKIGSTDRKLGSTDRKLCSTNFKSGPSPQKCLGFNPTLLSIKEKP